MANFVFPTRDLESSRVRLTPFLPDVHAKEFFGDSKDSPELYKYFRLGPFSTRDELVSILLEDRVNKDPGTVLFAILDKTQAPPRLAGMVGLSNSNIQDQCIEIGWLITLPQYQRTHVTSNAVGLLLHYCLELPAELAKGEQKYGPGLGLRRVQWRAYVKNAPSVRTAERMSFRREGIMRWQHVDPEDKFGFTVPPEREALCHGFGWHIWILSLCWDDWELEGAREAVQQQMSRP